MRELTYQAYINEKVMAGHLLEMGNLEGAIQQFEKAYQTPYGIADLDLMVELAFLYDEHHEQEKAFDLFHQMIEVDPTFATSYYGLATLYDNDQNYEKAIQYYQKAIELDAEYEAAHFFLANVYEDLNQPKQAMYHYEQTLEIDPEYMYAYLNLGCLYETSNQNLKAYHYFYKAYQLDSSDYMVLFNLGVVCRKLGQIKEAIRYYNRSIEVNPDHAYAYLNLAILYKEEYEDYQSSLEIYTKGLAHAPDVSVLYYNRACCYALTHQLEAAMDDLVVAVQISPSLIDYMQKDEELDVLKSVPAYEVLLQFKTNEQTIDEEDQ